MGNEFFISLIYNTSLLLVLVALYSGITFPSSVSPRWKNIVTGIIAGFIAMAVMANPWSLQAGVAFDVRSILLGVTGLFFGLPATAVAAAMAAAFRFYLGGAGVWMGVGVILACSALGLAWGRLRPSLAQRGGLLELYLFGVSLHLLMLACTALLPRALGYEVLASIVLPVLTVYPVGTVLLSVLLIHQRAARESDKTLLESKNLLESIVENAPVMIFLKEAATLRFAMLNRAGEELLGCSREDLAGRSDLDFFPPEQAAAYIAKDREVLNGKAGVVDIPQEPLLTARKEERVLHTMKVCIRGAEGAPKYLLGISEDITESRRAESAIRESNEMQGVLNAMLKRSLANVPLNDKLGEHLASLIELPWLAVQPKGAILLMGPLGNELVLTVQKGLPPALLKACSKVPLGLCLCGRAAASGEVVESRTIGPDHDITYEGMVPHGHYCAPITAAGRTLGVLNLYLREGVPLTDSQRGFIKSAADIIAENILHAQTEERLVQSQKMESVGRLAGGVAHDFNNILTAIRCYTEFLQKGLDPQDPKQADVSEILTAATRAEALTRQLLAFSRQQIMAPKVCDLNKCVGGVVNMLRRIIGENITLKTQLAPNPCLALLDTGQIGQVLVNLVVNARDAMAQGGEIVISTELLPPSEKLFIAHPELPRAAMVCLVVRDTGSGMSGEVKEHIFDPFFTTKEKGKGTGLGLPTVFGIIKQSGGDIEVSSEPDKGSEFRICFPYCDSDAGGGLLPETSSAGGELKGKEIILLVEDEESLRRLGKRLLEAIGYTVITAAGGEEALKELERLGKPVDLLLADVVMPGMNGRELGRELERRKLCGRTLYMSGYTDDAIVKHGVLEPGIAFIYKPFTVDRLSIKVREVLDGPASQARA